MKLLYYLSQWLCHITCHVIALYDEFFCHKCIATSSIFMTIFFVTNFLPHHLPCGLPHHHIYDEGLSQMFCHVSCHITYHAIFCYVISHVERHHCMNCDIFRHTYDELECHRFSDNCDGCHKIYDKFLLIIIIVHLTRTFCDDGVFVTMASPKYKP
jgi:hypothetical protein